MTRLAELPYRRDSAALFATIAAKPWSIFLDSGYPYLDMGRYDIMVADPAVTLESFASSTQVTLLDGSVQASHDDPFAVLRHYLGKTESNLTGLPFCGGALGYFAYDLVRRIESIAERAKQDIIIPDMAIGIYDWAVIVDHHKRCSWLASFGRYPLSEQKWSRLIRQFSGSVDGSATDFQVRSALQANMNQAEYERAFGKIQDYIRDGDCYQVNLAQRFSVAVSGEIWAAYTKLRAVNPAPFSAFIRIPQGAILSLSPERFLRTSKRMVETKPIKGTRARSVFAYEDQSLAAALLESEKDRAENLMIVDLLRNDLSKSCQLGSVMVPKLFALESFTAVHHLVSTVVGRLERGRHTLDLLKGCFPGGSITGAPKLRAMEIIEELEPHRRTVYCGAIGYIGFDGNMDTNIAIRTLVYHQDALYCWAGGGIVGDSRAALEYQECLDKIAPILSFFEGRGMQRCG